MGEKAFQLWQSMLSKGTARPHVQATLRVGSSGALPEGSGSSAGQVLPVPCWQTEGTGSTERSSRHAPPHPHTRHIRMSWEPVFPLPPSAETTSVYNCFPPGVGHSQATPAYSMLQIHGPATLSASEILPTLHSLSKTLVFDNRQIHSIS